MDIRRKFVEWLSRDPQASPADSTEPCEIGYVPMWQSLMLVTRLQEDGFHAVAIYDFRPASVAIPSPQPMSTIYVPEREAQDAQRRLEELCLP